MWHPNIVDVPATNISPVITQAEADELSVEVKNLSRIALQQMRTQAELMAELQRPQLVTPPAPAETVEKDREREERREEEEREETPVARAEADGEDEAEGQEPDNSEAAAAGTGGGAGGGEPWEEE